MLLYASQPQEPEASEVTTTSGLERRDWCIIERPFQCSMKQHHHIISEQASRLSLRKQFARLWWDAVIRSIRRRRKVRPGRMTMLASCNWPTSDSRSLLVQHLRHIQSASVDWRRRSLWCRIRSSCLTVSSSIPRKTRHDEESSCFSSARLWQV